MITTPRQALEFVRKHGIVTMTRSSHPSLVESIVGGRVKGSWWNHSHGRLIFKLAESLHDSKDVLSLKLVDGKVAFLHRSMWPALARMVMDPAWRRKAGFKLTYEAGRLFRAVEKKGAIRLDHYGFQGRKELEVTLLVHSGSMHTEKGSHTTVLTKWADVFDAETMSKSRKLSLEEALKKLGLSPVP